MLVDLTLKHNDAYMVQKSPDGRTIVSIPLDVLTRAYDAYLINKLQFDRAAQQEEGHIHG